MTDSVKTFNGIAVASVKTYQGIAKAGVKSVNGVSLGSTDPYWSSVGLLALNESGANGTTTFTDQSNNAQTLTAAGNAQWSSAWAPPNDTTSLLGDGTGDQVATGSSTSNKLYGTSTAEGFVRFKSLSAWMRAVVFKHASGKYVGLILGNPDTSKIELNHFGGGTICSSGAGVIAINTDYHWALDTFGGTVTLYINGVSVASGAAPWVNEALAVQMLEASPSYAGSGLKGYEASVRITPGVRRYTGAFTPPVPPLPTAGT